MDRPHQPGKSRAKTARRLSPEALVRRLEECWDEPDLPGGNGRPDAEGLQGAWETVAGPRPLELLVAGNHFAVRFRDGTVYMGDFELEPDAPPKTMVMRIEEGPARHKGKTARCVYDLDGFTLRWWLPEPGPRERPSRLPAEDDPRYLCVVLRRDGPHA
jgi:uncharacterized protein (TIGR03067 family)